MLINIINFIIQKLASTFFRNLNDFKSRKNSIELKILARISSLFYQLENERSKKQLVEFLNK